MLESTIVRDTAPRASDLRFGRGAEIQFGPGTAAANATIRYSLIDGCHDVGILVMSSQAVRSATLAPPEAIQWDKAGAG